MGGCTREQDQPVAAGTAAPAGAIANEAESSAQLARAQAEQLLPRRAIAGLAGFQIESRVVFQAAPERRHTLSATFLFPERVRLRMSLETPEPVERVLAYRCGRRGFFIGPRESASQELAGSELAALELQTELRRALFLWPDGFSWRAIGGERRADLGALGGLRATLDASGRPSEMHSYDAKAQAVESLREVLWKSAGARHFPSHFELWAGDERIWVEDVDKVQTALNYIDAFFLPPDRREARMEQRVKVRPIDLGGAYELRIALAPSHPATWAGAWAAADEQRTAWRGRAVELLEGDWVEVDARGGPLALLLRAGSLDAANQVEWTWREECPAWELPLERPSDVDAGRMADLIRSCPVDSVARLLLERVRGPDKAESFRLLALTRAR